MQPEAMLKSAPNSSDESAPSETIAALITEILNERNFAEETGQALRALDHEIFLWRRHILKREFAHQALRALGLDLEQTQFQTLSVIAHLNFGDTARPATIGAIGEEMALDPSRASRIVSELVAGGYARRVAAQDDGRKSCIRATDAGLLALSAFIRYKWRRMAEMFADWSEDDVKDFARLLARYNERRIATMDMPDQTDHAEADAIRKALDAELAGRT